MESAASLARELRRCRDAGKWTEAEAAHEEGERAALDRLWQDVVARKTYVTGGVGATARNEAFGLHDSMEKTMAVYHSVLAEKSP